MIDTGDTAWVLISAALVFIMTPGLGFFYGGMVRSKNVLTTIMQSFFIVAMISVEWMILGYTMTFGTDINGFIGSLEKFGLANVGLNVLEGGTILSASTCSRAARFRNSRSSRSSACSPSSRRRSSRAHLRSA